MDYICKLSSIVDDNVCYYFSSQSVALMEIANWAIDNGYDNYCLDNDKNNDCLIFCWDDGTDLISYTNFDGIIYKKPFNSNKYFYFKLEDVPSSENSTGIINKHLEKNWWTKL